MTNQDKSFSKIFYYIAVIRHPYRKAQQLPIAEFITNKHNQFAIEEFYGIVHEKEYRNYIVITNPRMVLTEFSWAVIHACLKVFC